MKEQGFSIGPWLQDNSRLPPRLFKKKNKHFSRPEFDIYKLNKTEEAIVRKLRTENNGIVFKDQRVNSAKVVTLDIGVIDESEARQMGNNRIARQQIHKKKSIRGFSIGSLKKKTFEFEAQTTSQKFNKTINWSHQLSVNSSFPQRTSPKSKSFSLNVSRMHLKTMPVIEDKSFLQEIVRVCQQKKRILSEERQLPFSDFQVERELFMSRNRKFRSWRKMKQSSLVKISQS